MSHTMISPQQEPRLDRDGKTRMIVVFLYVLVNAAVLFLAAGTIYWPAAWLYFGMGLSAYAIGGTIIIRKNPEIINERGRKSEETKPFDKVFARAYLPLLLLSLVIPGLNYRFGWSAMPDWLQIVGFLGLIPAMILPYWCMYVNDYLTITVRLQEERGHQVVSSGPYRFVRHPMYVGMILQAICMPLALGSWVALIPGALMAAGFVWRTSQEDRMLQAELAGYADYTQVVRYRLLPGAW